METITLGRSDLCVSRLGFGCWQLGGHGWQHNDQQAIIQAIHSALERGVNFFDTADVYGLGTSETLLAEALAAHPLGKKAVVATKFGVRIGANGTFYDNSNTWITEAVDASLKRLNRDTIDLYQVHWHDGKRPVEDIFADLEHLRTQGKIRWYGISNIPPSSLKTVPEGLASFTMEYSLLQRQHEQEINASKNLGFIAWGSLAQGLLSGKYSRESRFGSDDIRSREESLFAAKHWDYYEPMLHKLKEIAAHHHKTMTQTALRFVLDFVPHSVVLTGIKTSTQLEENARVLDWHLSPEAIADLQTLSVRA